MMIMLDLISFTKDDSLKEYEGDWIEKRKKDDYGPKNLSLTFYTSMVYGFAKHLPYSMDIEQPEYVPADFYNMEPLDVETNGFFKWEDRRTFFNSMVRWGDTFRTGMLLQMCVIFQKMLLGQFPHDFELKASDFEDWGIDEMTSDKDYNRKFFETLKSLPRYYQMVVNAPTNEERRKCLDNVYVEIMQRISARYGGFRKTDADGKIIVDSPGTIPIRPADDVSMRVYWDQATFYDGISSVIEAIKEEQLKIYKKNKPKGIEPSKLGIETSKSSMKR